MEKFKKMKLGAQIAIITAAVLVFTVAFWGACELFGSPIAKIRATSAAKNYIEMNMPGMEYDRSSCKYDRETDRYYIEITPDGRKTPFRLELTAEGRVTKDGYTLEYMYSDIFDK